LRDVLLICDGNKKQTNHHRVLLKNLAKGIIPLHWGRYYKVPKNLTLLPWITDFSQRIGQLSKIANDFCSSASSSTADAGVLLKKCVVWLGGLFTPEAYITATRQYVAQINSWSLEELSLEMAVFSDISKAAKFAESNSSSFQLVGLKLQGAEFLDQKIKLSTNIINDFAVVHISWNKTDERIQSSSVDSHKQINLPIYLNATRADILFTINMKTDQSEHDFYTRGVAILASTL
jgi:dynein heavy chain 1, cytosolic